VLFDRVDDGQWRRIVRASLGTNDALGRHQRHRALHVRQQHGAHLDGSPLGYIDLAVFYLLDNAKRCRFKRVGRDYGIAGAVSQRVRPFLGTAGTHPLNSVVHTDQARQPHRATPARHDTKLDLRKPYASRWCHHTKICSQTHLKAAALRLTIDAGNGRSVAR